MKMGRLKGQGLTLVMLYERVAKYADIDTRRAMGFLPRKLPPSNLPLRTDFIEYTELVNGPAKKMRFDNAQLFVTRDDITWIFGANDIPTTRMYCFRRKGYMCFYSLMKFEHTVHPDFNADGSFKRTEPRLLKDNELPM